MKALVFARALRGKRAARLDPSPGLGSLWAGCVLSIGRDCVMAHSCIVPECREAGRHMITLRCRRPDTSAVWAPTTGAYLCDKHATGGGELDLVFRPKRGGRLVVSTQAEAKGETGVKTTRTIEITGGPNRGEPNR